MSAAPDLEKDARIPPRGDEPDLLVDADDTEEASKGSLKWYIRLFERTVVRYNVEARGIQRVLPSQRHTTEHLGFSQICMLWVSINLTANNTTLGMLGPTVFCKYVLEHTRL